MSGHTVAHGAEAGEEDGGVGVGHCCREGCGGMGEEIEGVEEVRLDWASDDYVPILRMKVENGSMLCFFILSLFTLYPAASPPLT